MCYGTLHLGWGVRGRRTSWKDFGRVPRVGRFVETYQRDKGTVSIVSAMFLEAFDIISSMVIKFYRLPMYDVFLSILA